MTMLPIQLQDDWRRLAEVAADQSAIAKFNVGTGLVADAVRTSQHTGLVQIMLWFGSATDDPDGASVTLTVYGMDRNGAIVPMGTLAGVYGDATAVATIGAPYAMTAAALHGCVESWTATNWQQQVEEGASLTDAPAVFTFDSTGFEYLIVRITDLSDGTEPDNAAVYIRGITL